jgi:hypothetical protein
MDTRSFPTHALPVRTPAEARVAAALRGILTEASGWKAGVLLLTYRRPDAASDEVSMAHALGLVSLESALDVVMMVRRLRMLADELEQFVQGKQRTRERTGAGAPT